PCFHLLLICWMMFQIRLPQLFPGDVGIPLGCRKRFMSEQILHRPEIRPVIKQMCRKTVSDLMRVYMKITRTLFDHHIKDVSQSAGSQRAAPVVDPECSAVPDRPPVCLNVVTKGTRCLAAERDNSFFAPLAMDFDE